MSVPAYAASSPAAFSALKRQHNLAVARMLASAGIFIFPARVFYNPRSGKWEKVPCIKGWRTKATADLEQIDDWWRDHPNAVAGIELSRNKLVVIDPDRHGGPDGVDAFGALTEQHGSLPRHPKSLTPGGGEHHIFCQPDDQPLGNRTGLLPAGIDVRGAGGWVVAPGSIRADGKQWAPVGGAPSLAEDYAASAIPRLPDWLAAIIRSSPERPPSDTSPRGANGARSSSGTISREAMYARQALRGIADEIHRTPPNTRRNECLNAGAYRMGRMVARGWIDKAEVADELSDAAIASGLDVDEVQKTLASGLIAGMDQPAEDLQDRPRVQVNGHAPPQPTAKQEGPDPVPLPTGLLPVALFDYDMLPERMRPRVEDIAERMQCPPDYVGVSSMVALGSVIGRKVGVRPKQEDDWVEVANQWGLIIGAPGLLKTPAQNEALSSLRALEAAAREQFALAKAEYDAQVAVAELKARDSKEKAKNKLAKEPNADVTDLMRHVAIAAPVRRRYITINATTEALGEILKENPNGVVNVRDELMALLHKLDEEGESEARGFHLQGWSGVTDYNFDRIGRGLDNYIPAVCLSMIGGTQPAKISQYVAQIRCGNRGNDGLIQRFGLMVWPDISPEWINVDRYPKAMARDMATGVFERLDALDASAIDAHQDRIGDKEVGLPYLRLAPAAQELFLAWRTDLERRLRSGEIDPMMEGHIAKYRKLVPSLALIIHLADADATTAVGDVSVDAIQKALRWAAYLETHAARVYGSGDAALVAAASAIIAKVKSSHLNANAFSSRDVWRPQWSLLRDRDTAHSALKMLVDYDWLSATKAETNGRTAMVYAVSPKVLAQWKRPGG